MDTQRLWGTETKVQIHWDGLVANSYLFCFLDLYPALCKRLKAAYNKQATSWNLSTPSPPFPTTTASLPKPQGKPIFPLIPTTPPNPHSYPVTSNFFPLYSLGVRHQGCLLWCTVIITYAAYLSWGAWNSLTLLREMMAIKKTSLRTRWCMENSRGSKGGYMSFRRSMVE